LKHSCATVETLVNFVRDLMERVAKIEQNVTPLKDAPLRERGRREE
jgi:hypothetical protein